MRLRDVADFLGHRDTTMLITNYRHKVKRVVDLTAAQDRMLEPKGLARLGTRPGPSSPPM